MSRSRHRRAASLAISQAHPDTRPAGTRRRPSRGLAVLGMAVLFVIAPARAVENLTIAASGPDVNGDGEIGDDITGNLLIGQWPGVDSTITATALGSLLSSAGIRLAATNSITVNSAVAWNVNVSGGLGLTAPSIAINAPLTGSGLSVHADRVTVQSNIAMTGVQSWNVGDVTWAGGGLSGRSDFSELHVDVPSGKSVAFPVINGFRVMLKSNLGTVELNQPTDISTLTFVGAGTLRSFNTSGSATGESFVYVSGGTLAGIGRHAGTVVVFPGGRLEPGSPVGTLTLGGGLLLQDGAVINAALGSSSDRIVVNGGKLEGPPSAGGVTVNFSDAGGLTTGTYVLIDGRGSTLSGFTASDFKVGTAPENFSFTFRLEGNVLSVIVGPPAYGTGYLFTARDCRLRAATNDTTPYDCANIPGGTRAQRWSAPVGGNSGGGINSGSISLAFESNSGEIDASWGDGGTQHADAIAAQGLDPTPVPLGRVFGSIGFAGQLSLPVIKGYSQASDYSRTNSNLYAFQKYTYGGLTATQLPLALDLTYVIGNYSSPSDVSINPDFPGQRPGGAEVGATLSVVDARAVTIGQLANTAKVVGLNGLQCGSESQLGWPVGAILGAAVVYDGTDGGGVRQMAHSKPILSCANPGQPVALAAGQEFFVTAGLQIPARGTYRQPGDLSKATIEANGFVHADNTMLAVVDPAAPPEVVQTFVANTTPECSPNCNFASIDVKPGDAFNCINPKSKGSIPVALFGSNNLPVSQVDQATLRFGSLVPTSNKGKLRCSVQRVNADDQDDLVCQFGNLASNWHEGQASETLTGATLDGDPIEASDKVCIKQ